MKIDNEGFIRLTKKEFGNLREVAKLDIEVIHDFKKLKNAMEYLQLLKCLPWPELMSQMIEQLDKYKHNKLRFKLM